MNRYNVTTDQDDNWWSMTAESADDAAGRVWKSCDYYTDGTDHAGETILVRVQRVDARDEARLIGHERSFTRVFE